MREERQVFFPEGVNPFPIDRDKLYAGVTAGSISSDGYA